MMEPQVPAEIATAMGKDERVIWVSKPTDRLVVLNGLTVFLIYLGVGYAGAALWMQLEAIKQGEVFVFFCLIPFVGVGLWLSFGRLLIGRHYRRMMTYALTNRKAYIFSNAFVGRLIKKPITSGTWISFHLKQDATIHFDPPGSTYISFLRHIIWPSYSDRFEFFRIPDGPQAMTVLRDIERGQL